MGSNLLEIFIGMFSQCGIYMGLSGSITCMTRLVLPFGLLRPSIPLFTLEDKEVVSPVHFMLNQDQLFCPTITLGFGAKPMNTVDYKKNRHVMSRQHKDRCGNLHSVIQSLLEELP